MTVRPSQLNTQAHPVQTMASAQATAQVPELWQPAVRAHLVDGETLLASIETDLDDQLQFARGLIVLTNQRLSALSSQGMLISTN